MTYSLPYLLIFSQQVPIQFSLTYVREGAGRLYRIYYPTWQKRNTAEACLLPCRLASQELRHLVDAQTRRRVLQQQKKQEQQLQPVRT